jgi:molybdopterin-containing oxidoreductase family membrane subunit
MVSLFVISLLINLGMWLERVFIVVSSLAHDFLPHNWGTYFPTWVELTITTGSFAFFFFWFFGFSKLLPTVPLSDLKMRIADEEIEPTAPCDCCVKTKIEPGEPAVLAVFSNAGRMVQALKAACDGGFRTMETFSPVKVDEAEKVMVLPKSPVRFWTLAGALCGLAGGFWLAIGTGLVNSLVVGGKPPDSIIPYCVVGFEGTILLGSLANFLGLLFHTRLFRMKTSPYYDPRFSRDMFGVLVSCKAGECERLQQLLASASPEEIHVHR